MPGDPDHLGDRRRGARDVHAGRLPVPGGRLLADEERGHDRAEDPRQLLDRGALLLGGRLRARLRRRRLVRGHARARSWAPANRRSVPGDGVLAGGGAGQVLLPVRLLRGVAGDRLGHDDRAHQVRRVPDLRGRLQLADLPDHQPLDLRRRLAPGQPRHAGLRRLDGGAPDRRHRRARGAAPARPAARQVRQRRQAERDPRPQHAARRAWRCWCCGSAGSASTRARRSARSAAASPTWRWSPSSAPRPGVLGAMLVELPARRGSSTWA